ncbi:polyketide cyclase/dehydrase/lipid transport protein [Tenacibaculum lutimaris]|uniref:Polyketide cyclase/dehydrase/lipid transport protein n=1 Tax=Tenacibaculum lutimaris TaxID=285258 RepID=A0A420DZN7_9FLAO|nr:SRPBCC family protein [Tenacibaculum lutimaris]RKF03133.1 polyketide cyclase/dehydrase/lipid transport protein [Tenacibaculum lutimaris]
MKKIKIILGIITALILAFFLTGLVVQEVVYTNEVTVNKPVKEVFSDFQNVELMKQWMPEVKSIETLEEKPNKVGSTYKVVVENQGKLVTMTEEVLAFKENEKLTFHFDAENMLKTDDYVFTSEGNTTKIVQTTTCTSESYVMSCLFPYFKGALKKMSQQYLDEFKKASETHN